MILESGIKFRDFSEQPAFSFNLDLSLSSSSGNSSFGISGSNGGYDLFKFNNGRVFDPLNRFIYSYSKSDTLSVSGNFRSGVFGYYINNNPVALNVNVCNPSYTFKNIYLSTKNSTMDFNVDIYGYRVPSYDFAFSNTSFLTGNSITGAILNTSNDSWSSFKVFSGNASFSYSGYKFQSVPASSEIPYGQSGLFSFNYSGAGSEYTVSASTGVEPLAYNINLYTNFGLVNKTGLLNLGYSPLYFIDFYRYSTGYINNTYSWGYYLDGVTCNQLPFIFKLEKVSGFNYTNTTTGNLNFTGNATGSISNYIYGTGFLNGLVASQYLASNQYDYYGNLLTLQGFTGIHSGDLIYKSGFIDASGYSFHQSVSGSVFGSGYVSDISSTIYKSVSQDALTHNFYSWSGSSSSGILTGITGSKATGETYEYFIPGNFYVTNLDSPIIPISGVFTGQNTASIQYTGLVVGSGFAYSSPNYSLVFSGIFTGMDPTGAIITETFTSGVNYTNGYVFSTGASASGISCSIKYSDYIFSGSQSGFYLDSNYNVVSGKYVLQGLTGSFNIIPNTDSGTYFVNTFSTGDSLPIDTGNFYAYYPAFGNYPQGFANSWTSGYSIDSDLSTLGFTPFKYGMGDPLSWEHRDYSWQGKSYFYSSSSLNDSYIRVSFNNDVAAPGFICDSYCLAAHPEYPSPSSWSISGSNDSSNWTLLHSKSGENLQKNYLNVYSFSNSTFYKYLHFKINATDDPTLHIPCVSDVDILNDNYNRGFAKFLFLKKIKLTKYLSPIVSSIPQLSNNTNLSGSSASSNYPNEWYRAFDSSDTTFSTIYNANLTTNDANNRGVIISKNLENTGVITLGDLSQATSITAAACNDLYNFYGGQFSTFKGSARYNFAVTDKNNALSANGVFNPTNPVIMIVASGDTAVFSASGETRFLSGSSLTTLNSSNLYPGCAFASAEKSSDKWKLGGAFFTQFNSQRITSFSGVLGNSNGMDYVLNNGLIYTNLSGSYITGFPLVRNTGATGPANWESGVDSDGYSQLRYNLHNEDNGNLKTVRVSGIISHDLYIPQINKTKKVTYLYGDFSTSKFFRGRGYEADSTNVYVNPQGRYLHCQRMSSGRDCLLNYEFLNSGFYGGNGIKSMQIDEASGNLMCFGEFTNFHANFSSNKGHLAFFSLPSESVQIPKAQDLKNAYNGIYDPAFSGYTTGGFVLKNLPIFNCDSSIYSSFLSGSTGLFLGGNFYNARINSSSVPSFQFQRSILLNPYASGGTGVIVTGYGINNGTVYAIDVDNYGRVHFGGDFTTTVTSARNRYASYSIYGAALQPLDLNLNSTIWGMRSDRSTDSLWIVGDFTTLNAGTATRNRAAKINLAAGSIDGWNTGAGFNARVKGIVTGFNGDLIFYGNFSQFSGINCRHIAKFNSAGTFITGGAGIYLDNSLRTDTNADTSSCVVDPVDGSIYLTFQGNNSNYAADFENGNNFNYSYRRAVRYDYNTLKHSGVAANFIHGYPYDIKYWNDRLIFGGNHFGVGVGQFTNNIAAFVDEPTGTLLTTFNPNLNGRVNSACKVSDGLILAGDFRSCDGYAASGLVKIDFYGNRITGFAPNCQNPNIIKIKNTPSGIFAFSTKPWNAQTSGNFYKIDPDSGTLLKNYFFNLPDTSYSDGDFFIDNTINSIGHVVIGNIKTFNPTSFLEYTFSNPINSIQGYNITFTGTNPVLFNFMASGVNDTSYRTIDTKNTSLNGKGYSNFNIDYALSGIKKVRFDFLASGSTGVVGISNAAVYEKTSGFMTGISLSLGHVRGSGIVYVTGTPDYQYTGYDHTSPYLDPNDLSVPAVYRKTGYLSSSTFSGVINGGKYKSSLKFGTIDIMPSSGSDIINNVKINTITGLKKASASFKLINGFDSYLTDNVDHLIFNTGSFNSLNQNTYSFYYMRALYNPLSSNQFSGAQDLVNKINTYHSNWLSGDYNQASRVLTFSSPSSIGHSGNYMYFQPVIKSGIDKFLDPSFNFSTSGFYFTGGATYFLNMNTGISGFHSGKFMVDISNPNVYFHKTEYGSFLNNFSANSTDSYVSHFFTGYTGVIYSGYNSYSNPYYATGNIDYVYSVNLTGLASGYNSSTNSSGIVKAIINKTGLISSQAVSGFASWKDFAITGTGSVGNVYVIPSGGTSYTEISKYWYGNFTGAFNFQAVKSGFYSLSTGIPVSTYTGASWVDYECRFDRNFSIKTGSFSSNGSVIYSGVNVYYDSGNNVYSGSGILNSTSCLPFNVSPAQYVNFEIAHYNPYNSGNNVMKYTISGITGSYLFTGLIKE